MNLGNQPVEVLIEDVYLLVVPSSESTYDAEEEERRMQAAKAERLQNAELLHLQGQAEQGQSACLHAMQIYGTNHLRQILPSSRASFRRL